MTSIETDLTKKTSKIIKETNIKDNNQNIISLKVDKTNPGQYFACCGLFEIANRLYPDVEAWFDEDNFNIFSSTIDIKDLPTQIKKIKLEQIDPGNKTSSPIRLIHESFSLIIDWYENDFINGKSIKTWAGQMSVFNIARAIQYAVIEIINENENDFYSIFDIGTVLFDPSDEKKKVEPYYFDSRRSMGSKASDRGYSINELNKYFGSKLKFKTITYSAIEFLCFIGLQRFLPALVGQSNVRLRKYFIWHKPVPIEIAAVISCGAIEVLNPKEYQFEIVFCGQGNKMFCVASPIDQ